MASSAAVAAQCLPTQDAFQRSMEWRSAAELADSEMRASVQTPVLHLSLLLGDAQAVFGGFPTSCVSIEGLQPSRSAEALPKATLYYITQYVLDVNMAILLIYDIELMALNMALFRFRIGFWVP